MVFSAKPSRIQHFATPSTESLAIIATIILRRRDMETSPDLITQFALAGGLAWASGVRLYAVCCVLGLLGHFQWLELPGHLNVLANPYVLGTSSVLCACEFVADKVPWFDSIWDAVHTLIRGPGGAVLAAMAVSGGADQPAVQAMAAILGGTIATGTHLTKAGARAVINHSPEPFSNWAASTGEDVASLGILWLAWQHPVIFCVVLVLFLALMAYLLPKLWRGLRALWRKLGVTKAITMEPPDGDLRR